MKKQSRVQSAIRNPQAAIMKYRTLPLFAEQASDTATARFYVRGGRGGALSGRS